MKHKTIKAFIFDLDGVITNTVKLHFQTWKQLFQEEGIPFSRADNEKLRGLSRLESLQLILGDRPYPKPKLQDLLTRKNTYYLKLVTQMTKADLLPGVKHLLLHLQQSGYLLAVASSSRNTKIVLNQLGITALFQAVIDANTVTKAKPAPDLFLQTAKVLDVASEQCVVIEDSAAGITAAKAAKMLVIGVGPNGRVGGADQVYPNLNQINFSSFINDLEHLNAIKKR